MLRSMLEVTVIIFKKLWFNFALIDKFLNLQKQGDQLRKVADKNQQVNQTK